MSPPFISIALAAFESLGVINQENESYVYITRRF
jgi:hypothetical protein